MEKLTFDPNAAALPDSGIFGLTHSEKEADFVLVPVPFDATTSYRKGTAEGPEAIVDASRQIDLFDLDLGRVYESGIALADEAHWAPDTISKMNARAGSLAQPIIDGGGVLSSDGATKSALGEVNAICSEVNDLLRAEVARLLDAGKIVGIVGGDHATPFGSIAAHAERFPKMSLLHIDAHADLREAFEGFTWSHASIIFNAATRLPSLSRIVQVGVRDFCEAEFDVIQKSVGRIQTFFDASLFRRLSLGESWTAICEDISSKLSDDVYISFDIDGLSPDFCPNTGTPVPGGLSFNQINRLFEVLVGQGHRIIGFDLVEVSPGQSGDEWDANVGARLLYKLIGWTKRSRMDGKV